MKTVYFLTCFLLASAFALSKPNIPDFWQEKNLPTQSQQFKNPLSLEQPFTKKFKNSILKNGNQDKILSIQYRLDSIIVYSTQLDTMKHIYLYDSNGKDSIIFTQYWKNNQWADSIRESYNYDEKGNELSVLYELWLNGQWVNNSRGTYTYNSKDNSLMELYESWQNGQWVYHSRNTYSYDSKDNKLTYLWEDWKNGQWVNDSKSFYTYDSQGNLLTEIDEFWQIGGKWENSTKLTYTYDSQGNMLTYLWEQWQSGQWVKNYIYTYTYYSKGKRLTSLGQHWQNGQWENYIKATYTYDSKSNLIKKFAEIWQNGQWENCYNIDYSYDINNNLIYYLDKIWQNGQWENGSRYKYTFGNFRYQKSLSYELYQDSAWVNSESDFYYVDPNGLNPNNSSSGQYRYEFYGYKMDIYYTLTGSYDMNKKFKGICYSPYRDNEDPNKMINPTSEEILEDLVFLRNLTQSIRVYDISGSMREIPHLCDSLGLDCYLGINIGSKECLNERNIDSLIKIVNENHPSIKGVVIGNEVLLNNYVTSSQLQDYISKVKSGLQVHVPVGYADTRSILSADSNLVKSCDFVMAHIYAYWDGIANDTAAQYVFQKWNDLTIQYPNVNVYLGETGWPSQGDANGAAVPSQANQNKFLSDFLQISDLDSSQYFYFEAFEEYWKTSEPNNVGPYWGLYMPNGELKVDTSLVPPAARKGFDRQTRTLMSIPLTLPIIIYSDCQSDYFVPSGWYGNTGDLYLDDNYTNTFYSGSSCIKINYTPTTGFAGILWQFPVNNWGTLPGYYLTHNLKDSVMELTFQAKSAENNTTVLFSICPLGDTTQPYYNTVKGEGNYFVLDTNWKQITLRSFPTLQDSNFLISIFQVGFSSANQLKNCTIYIDDIVLKTDIATAVNEQTFSNQGILCYPNPTTGKIRINYKEQLQPASIQVINSLGIPVLNCQLNTGEIDLSNEPPGVYLLKITDIGSIKYSKIIKY